MDTMQDLLRQSRPTAARPLLGLTVLAVEDSRFACEALRLMTQASGARLRRADSLMAAERHLRTYRPGAVLVDMGLPDGSGATLIRQLAAASPRVDVILALSGDPGREGEAMAAGADGFLAKPVASLAAFQAAILRLLPADRQPSGPRAVPTATVTPDPLALRDDLDHAARALSGSAGPRLDYAAQFVQGLARSAGDRALEAAAEAVAQRRAQGAGAWPEVAHLAGLVRSRLAASPTM